MRNKRYTNTTFTKRVDHEGGLHRTPRSPAEPAFCEICGAVYSNRRWTMKSDGGNRRKHFRPVEAIICPTCKQIDASIVGGYVSLTGDFLREHRKEILSLLANEEERAIEDNPLSRVMTWLDTPDGVTIETTTEHLAQRFGRALEKAFKGRTVYDFSHENKVARVTWHRD